MPDELATTMTADILPNAQGPALSATSDMPEIKAEPPALSAEVNNLASETADDETQDAAESPEAEAEGEAATTETVEEPDPVAPVEAKGVGKKLARQEAEIKAANDRAAALEATSKAQSEQLATALKAIEQLTIKPTPESTPEQIAAEARPNREAFDTPEAYDTALVEWAGREAAKVATAAAEKKASDDKAAQDKQTTDDAIKAETGRLMATHNDRRAKFIETHPDYEAVAESDGVTITPPMAHAILQAENGPALAYYLGQHPEEAARISALNPVLQVFEVGRIADRLVPKPQITKAPAPVKPLGARQAAVEKSLDEMSMDEYAARRQPQIAAARKPFVAGVSKPN